jgi:processive 1,2-diacylglycerol beta-glucosyltransferase
LYKWYESECPECHVPLVEEPDVTEPDETFVSVFHADDPALMPLAQLALEDEGIQFVIGNRDDSRGFVRLASLADVGVGGRTGDILVASRDADRARELLADLEQAKPAGDTATPSTSTMTPSWNTTKLVAGPLVPLYDKDTGARLGDLSEEQLQFLIDHLELESSDDQDLYITAATIDLLHDEGAPAPLIDLLRRALGQREGLEIAWRD